MTEGHKRLEAFGIEIEVYRAPDGAIVVGIDTPDFEPDDPGTIRVWLNHEVIHPDPESKED